MEKAIQDAVVAESATADIVAQVGQHRKDLHLQHLKLDAVDVGVEEDGAAVTQDFQGGSESHVVGGKARVFSQDGLNGFHKGMGRAGLSARALELVEATLVVGLGQLKLQGLELNEQGAVSSVCWRHMEKEGHEVGQQLGHIIGAVEAAARENLRVVRSGFDVISHGRAVGNGRIVGVPAVDLGCGRGEGQGSDVVLVSDQAPLVEGVWGELGALDGGHERTGEHLGCEVVEDFPAGP
jgi:hypothetical protein